VARPESFAGFVSAALVALARETPAAYARLADCAGAEGVRLEVESTPFVVRFGARSHSLEPAPAAGAVDVRSDRETLLALLDAELTLLEAIESDRLHIQGETDAVLRFEQALGAFLEGAVRAPSFPALLAAFRGARPGDRP
jgi:hypothetical protein